MSANLTTMDPALKETWTSSRIVEQLYNDNPFFSRVKKLKMTQVGQAALTPIHTGRNWGYSAKPASGGALNAAGSQELKQASWQYKHHYQQIEIESAAVDGTANDTLSVAQVIDNEVTGGLDDLNRQLTRQLFLNGDGIIATCGTTAGATEIVLEAASGGNALERNWLAIGSVIDVGTAAAEDADIASGTITAVTESLTAPTITTATSVTTDSSDFVSLADSRDGATSYEINGLKNIVSATADLGGLSVASVPSWKAAGVTTTSQALTIPLMLDKQRQVAQKTGKRPDFLVTGYKQEAAFYKLLQAQVRFAGDSVAAGGNNPKWNGMDIQSMPDCQNEEMYFLTIGDFHIVSNGDPYWQNKHAGGQILEWKQGYTSYVAALMYRMNLGVERRNSHARLGGLT